MIEVHAAAPLSKRERYGLSAKDAYIAKALDGFHIAVRPGFNKHRRLYRPSGQESGIGHLAAHRFD
jgi:hypothetical protein